MRLFLTGVTILFVAGVIWVLMRQFRSHPKATTGGGGGNGGDGGGGSGQQNES